MGEKDSCKFRSEATTSSDILYLLGQGNLTVIWENSEKSQVIFKCEIYGNHDCVECVRLIK